LQEYIFAGWYHSGKLCMDELQTRNPPLIVTLGGSKGSKINTAQMIASVSQHTAHSQ